MEQFEDSTGLAVTAAGPAAVVALEQTQNAYLGSRSDVTARMQATEFQSDMPMALVMAGYLNLMFATPAATRKAHESLEALRVATARVALNARENHYRQALEVWCEGHLDRAAEHLELLLGEYPKDAFALKIVQYLHLYGGSPELMRQSAARVFDQWSAADTQYGYVQGIYAFALEEAGDYDAAEALGKQAVEANADDAWAAHAVAHVFEMTGRAAAGVEWLGALSDRWTETNNFRYHLDWHQALFLLELGKTDAALALYDARVREDLAADFYLDQCNAAALLQRLVLYGADVGDRWNELAELARQHLTDRELVFATMHQLLALLAAGDLAAARRLCATLEGWRDGQQGLVARRAGVPLARSLTAYFDGNFAAAAAAMEEMGEHLEILGGSHAQRDLFTMIYVDALLAAGRVPDAEAMLRARAENAPPTSWNFARLEHGRGAFRPGR